MKVLYMYQISDIPYIRNRYFVDTLCDKFFIVCTTVIDPIWKKTSKTPTESSVTRIKKTGIRVYTLWPF